MTDTLQLDEAIDKPTAGAGSDFAWGGASAQPVDNNSKPSVLPNHLVPQLSHGGSQSSHRTGKIKKADVLMFTSQLSVMCKSGVDIAEALQDAAAHCQHPQLRVVLQSIYLNVSNGTSFSAALRPYEHVFGGAYIGSITAAESSGSVDVILARLAELLRNQIRMRGSLIASLTYPVALMGIASIVILALIFFVLPQFAKVFEKMDKTPPPLTRLLLDGAAIARGNALLIGFCAAGAIVGLYQYSKTKHSRRVMDHVVLKVALLGIASRSILTGSSFRLMGCMLQSGVPLLETVGLCQAAVKNHMFREMFLRMEHDVTQGSGIGPAIAASTFLPPGVPPMVATAERTGRLGEVLELVGEYYEEDGERRLRHVVALVEPVVIILMGIVVAVVVSSVMLPLLNVSSMSH